MAVLEVNSNPQKLVDLKTLLTDYNSYQLDKIGIFYYVSNADIPDLIKLLNAHPEITDINIAAGNSPELKLTVENARLLAENKTLTFLNVGKQSDDVIIELAKTTTLKDLNIGGSEFGHAAAKALGENQSLTKLGLDWCKVDDRSAQLLAKSNTLTKLFLGLNEIGDKGAIALSKSRSLKMLDFGSNDKITNKGAFALAQNRSLRVLILWASKINDKGIKAFLKNDTLEAIGLDSNISAQTCDIVWKHLAQNKKNNEKRDQLSLYNGSFFKQGANNMQNDNEKQISDEDMASFYRSINSNF